MVGLKDGWVEGQISGFKIKARFICVKNDLVARNFGL